MLKRLQTCGYKVLHYLSPQCIMYHGDIFTLLTNLMLIQVFKERKIDFSIDNLELILINCNLMYTFFYKNG